PDREQQHDDPQLGEWLDPLGVRDGQIVEPRISAGESAEPRRPDQDSDQDEADDRADPQPSEGRDDDPGGTEDDQRIAEAGRGKAGAHERDFALFARAAAAECRCWRSTPTSSAISAATRSTPPRSSCFASSGYSIAS